MNQSIETEFYFIRFAVDRTVCWRNDALVFAETATRTKNRPCYENDSIPLLTPQSSLRFWQSLHTP